MTAFMPMTLSWRPAILAGAVMLTGTWAVSLANLSIGGPMLLLAPSALLVSASLLYLRVRAFRSTSVELTRASALATTEPLTGLLNRRGLLTQVPRLADDAVLTGRKVRVSSIQILDLDAATRQYGQHYIRTVLSTTAAAIESVVRVSDLVGAWPDDEFLVVGLGDAVDPAELEARIDGQLNDTGISLGRSPLRVRVGSADGDPKLETFEQILEEARSARGSATASTGSAS